MWRLWENQVIQAKEHQIASNPAEAGREIWNGLLTPSEATNLIFDF